MTTYRKDILFRLATETNLAAELLEQQRRHKPSLLADFLRSFTNKRVPSGFEVRNRITTIIRGLAVQGRAIIVGQGGAAATSDLPNGLSIRLEAPEDWRVRQMAAREGMTLADARKHVRRQEKEREYLRSIYETPFSRRPAFHIVFDSSVFTLPHIAEQVILAMRQRGCI